jgi:single-strand DNA-binding protein
MKSLNRVQLLGHIGKDPETRTSSNGSTITMCSLATSESWKDKQSGELQERTEWHRVKFFGRLAEIASEYLHKGDRVLIDGRLHYATYTDKDGVERYTADVIADNMIMLMSPRATTANSSPAKPATTPAAPFAAKTPKRPAEQPKPQPERAYSAPVPEDDDIPF